MTFTIRPEAERIPDIARHMVTAMNLVGRVSFLAGYQGDSAALEAEVRRQHAKQQADFALTADAPPDEPLSEHEQHKAELKANRESYERLGSDDLGSASR